MHLVNRSSADDAPRHLLGPAENGDASLHSMPSDDSTLDKQGRIQERWVSMGSMQKELLVAAVRDSQTSTFYGTRDLFGSLIEVR
ncbi:UNVERIFIED_CONTAM: hypothetical protein ACS92_06270 [Bacillus cereus]